MSDQAPTPQQAAQAMRELSQRRKQVRDAPRPLWAYLAASGVLAVTGLTLDLWPRLQSWSNGISILILLGLSSALRSQLGRTTLGLEVSPRIPWLRFWRGTNARGYVVIVLVAVEMAIGTQLLEQHPTRWQHTIVYGVAALTLVLALPWRHPTTRTDVKAIDDAR
jgi:hypothetical protein